MMRKLQESFDKGWEHITVSVEGFESKYAATSDKWTSKKQTQTWQRVAMRGLFVSLVGLLVLCWRGFPLIALVLIFGIYALVERKWELILSALVGFCMGLFTMVWSGLTTLALIYLVAGLVAGAGGLTVLYAIRLRRELKGASLAILDASMSFAFGALLSSLPLSGASAITWVIGMYALFFGLLLDVLAYRMHGRTSAS